MTTLHHRGPGPGPASAPATVAVPFSGERAGEWPVTFAQGNVYDWLTDETAGAVFGVHTDLPPGSTVDDVCRAVGVLASRHEGLRTVYLGVGGGERRQVVAGNGVLEVLVVEAGARARSRRHVTDPVRPFTHAREFPVRFAVVTDGGVPARVVLECSHLALDLAGASVLLAELHALLALPPAARVVGPRRWQPSDQADYERTPASVRHQERTLDYWRRRLQELPPCLLAVPPREEGPARFRLATLRSPGVAASLRAVSARTRVTPANVLTATIATLLSWWTDSGPVPVDVLYGNRSQPHLQGYVGSAVQSALVPFERAPSFHATLRRTQAAVLNAYRYADFDATAIAALVEDLGVERGCPRHRDLVVNDMSTAGGDAFDGAASPPPGGRTEILTGLETTTADPVRLSILRTGPSAVLGLTHDARHVTESDAGALLESLERVLATAATRDLADDELAGLAGPAPLRRPPGWERIGSSWIDVAGCGRLLRAATGTDTARVFVTRDPDGAASLVGWAAVPGPLAGPLADPLADPRELHVATVRQALLHLGDAHGVLAPDRYVICDRAPTDPDDPAAWQARRPLATGPGR